MSQNVGSTTTWDADLADWSCSNKLFIVGNYLKYPIFWYPSSWCLLLFGEPKWSQPECCGTAIQEQMGWLMSLSQHLFFVPGIFNPVDRVQKHWKKQASTSVSESVNTWNLARSCMRLGNYVSILYVWLVVYLPLWKIWKSIGSIIPNIFMEKENSCSKPPTRYVIPMGLRNPWILANCFSFWISLDLSPF